MTRTRFAAALAFVLSASAGTSLLADVRTEEKNLVRFEGGLGKVINFFAGKAAKDGVKSSVAVKGDRKASFGENDGTIVDLKEEKVYELNMKKKTYTVVTFAEIRRRMEEARRRAEEEQRKAEAEQAKEQKKEEKTAEKEPQMEVDFDVKETGQKKAINGFDTRQVVMTITMREKGKTLEQSGGLVITSDMWVTASVAAMKELIDFEIRYAKQLNGPETFGASVEQMQAALAAHPQLRQGLAKMAEESKKMDGTAILTTTTMESVKSAEMLAAEQKANAERAEEKSAPPTSVGGLIGGFGRRMAKKNDKDKEEAGPKTRAAFMTITNERLSISTTVAANDVAMPAGFRAEN